MSHFYGTLRGSGQEVSRTGGKESGVVTYAASWKGAVRCLAYIDEKTGQDWVTVALVPWRGEGSLRTLYAGPISGEER